MSKKKTKENDNILFAALLYFIFNLMFGACGFMDGDSNKQLNPSLIKFIFPAYIAAYYASKPFPKLFEHKLEAYDCVIYTDTLLKIKTYEPLKVVLKDVNGETSVPHVNDFEDHAVKTSCAVFDELEQIKKDTNMIQETYRDYRKEINELKGKFNERRKR